MASDDRIGQPISISDMFLQIGKNVADTQLERGDITKRIWWNNENSISKPKITKADGGIVNLSNGGDALLGQMVEKLKNKPKLGSSTQTMGSVIMHLIPMIR